MAVSVAFGSVGFCSDELVSYVAFILWNALAIDIAAVVRGVHAGHASDRVQEEGLQGGRVVRDHQSEGHRPPVAGHVRQGGHLRSQEGQGVDQNATSQQC